MRNHTAQSAIAATTIRVPCTPLRMHRYSHTATMSSNSTRNAIVTCVTTDKARAVRAAAPKATEKSEEFSFFQLRAVAAATISPRTAAEAPGAST